MPSLKPRLDRLEARSPHPGYEPITEVHHHIINPDRTPALNPDGTPMIIISRVSPAKVP
jgi:hypothetical protein